ncbi:MAG: hypothetical protein K5891_00245 [Lachnospiraceae bacterium]|nr:hypothetical protein [Lachnospiraceae bacterium]
MLNKPTEELEELLERTSPGELNAYLKDNARYLADEEKAFYYYMKDMLDEHRVKLKDVYSFAGVSESYGSKIITMEKHTTDRDLILRFCIAGHLLLDETNRALKLYGMRELYAKDPRDACLIVALLNRNYDMGEIDSLLEEQGLLKITKEE